MRSKAPLAMMEQMVMILVFALAAALCLQAFVKSDQMSRDSENQDRAAALCQSAAEAIRHCGGDADHALSGAAELLGIPYGAFAEEGHPLEAHYDENWTISATREYSYYLYAQGVDSGVDGLCKAVVGVCSAADHETVFELEVAWQEVSAHG